MVVKMACRHAPSCQGRWQDGNHAFTYILEGEVYVETCVGLRTLVAQLYGHPLKPSSLFSSQFVLSRDDVRPVWQPLRASTGGQVSSKMGAFPTYFTRANSVSRYRADL